MRHFQRFKADQRGTTAVIFGLSLLPVMGFVGSAIDYGRAGMVQTDMQRAADMTALTLVKEPITTSEADLNLKGQAMFSSVFRADKTLDGMAVSVSRTPTTVTVAAGGTLKTAIMQVVGVPRVPVSTQAVAAWNTGGSGTRDGSGTKLELALVLDNTGSMGDLIDGKQKMKALQDATTSMLGDLRTVATSSDTVKVSVVPFDSEVRFDANQYRYKPWFQWSNDRRDPDKWSGYVFERPGSYATSDDAPTASVPNSLYPAPRKSEYDTDLAAMRPLTSITSGYSDLVRQVGDMRPRGYTNVGLGVTWGFSTLTPSEPFTEGVALGTAGVKKVMIVLTDGDNTRYHVDGVERTISDTNLSYAEKQVLRDMNSRTLDACTKAKAGGQVEVFTIRLLAGDANLLRSCATDPSHFFDVQKSVELTSAFRTILGSISGTRLTH